MECLYYNSKLGCIKNLTKKEKENKRNKLPIEEKNLFSKKYKRITLCYNFKKKFIERKMSGLGREGQNKNL